MKSKPKLSTLTLRLALALTTVLCVQSASAALALDRTRAIMSGSDQSISLNVTNQNKALPYLAQAWMEDAQGNKINDPMVALPPVQRVEPGMKTQVKVQGMAGAQRLPQDRESLFYFNLREIPPKSNKPNTLQIALQSRIKVFYRPAALVVGQNTKPWQESLTLSRQGDHYVVNNPTPYYVTISDISATETGKTVNNFKAVMIEPKGSLKLDASAAEMGSSPVVSYINDYGGRPKLVFGCSGNTCSVKKAIVG